MSDPQKKPSSASESVKHFVLVSLFAWTQALGMPLGGALLLALLMHYSGLAAVMTPFWWIASMPLIYVIWMLLFFALSALEMQLVFWRYEKPRHMYAIGPSPEAARHFRLIVCYLRAYVVRCLPLSGAVSYFPGVGKLFYLAYAPSCHIGKKAFFAGFMYDPDLTEIGEETVVGGSSVLSSHSMATKGQGNCTYVSAKIRLCDRVTVGGECRIGMGVTIGADSIVEPFSNVISMTYIPPGEVWGGNPAVFLRKRADLPVDTNSTASEASDVSRLASDATTSQSIDLTQAARRVVERALNIAPDSTDNLESLPEMSEWDSLVQFAIAATLADTYECRLTPRQITSLKTLADVEQAIAASQSVQTANTNNAAIELPSDPEWLPLLPSADATRMLAQATPVKLADTPLPIVIAASFTAEPIASSFSLWTAAFGIATEVEFCGYNQITQALLSPHSSFQQNATGLNVVLLRTEDLPEDATAARVALESFLDAMRQFVSRGTGGTLVVGTLPPPLSATFGGDRAEFASLRLYWSDELKKIDGVQCLDFAGVIERIGLSAAGDAAMELAARAPYSTATYRELGIELARLVRCKKRPRAKVLALDCDNTLWGGVLGEDGFDGIQIGNDGEGRSYQAFQRVIQRLRQQGILLVLVSRNEEADVLDVFDRHPGMILRREDIAAWRINWQPKSQNLESLSQELNLGIDSFVFVDDDSAQRLQVASALPTVHVFPTPVEPSLYASTLSKLWLFDAERITSEDLERTAMLRQEQARQQLLNSDGGLSGYLDSLELQVEMREADARDLPRVVQLTQKTNQFNLSLRRRTLEEIKALGNDYRIFVLSARDKFGDYGQIGVCILRCEPSESRTLEIDTFLVSCRALGRGVEDAFLYGVFEVARRLDLSSIHAPFVAGPRNQPAREFFARCDFRETASGRFEAEAEQDFTLPRHVRFQLDHRDAIVS